MGGLVLLAGCSVMDKALLRQEITAEVTETEQVTDLGGVLSTNFYYSTNYFTNYVASPAAEFVAEATNAIPGWGGLISTILSGGIGIFVALKNKKRLHAAVLATEAGRQILLSMADGDRIDDAFKSAMVEEQEYQGQKEAIGRIVRTITKKTHKKVR